MANDKKSDKSSNVKVRVLAPNFIKHGSKPGDEFTISEAQAARLSRQGRVEYVSKARQEAAEAATGSRGEPTSPTPGAAADPDGHR